jgi:hypothetical protein
VIAATAFLAAAIFLGMSSRLRIVSIARQAAAVARETATAMREPGLDDLARERISRRAAVNLAAATASIGIRTMAAAAAGFAPVWAASALDIARTGDVFSFLAGWQAIVATTVVAAAVYLLRMRLWPTS